MIRVEYLNIFDPSCFSSVFAINYPFQTKWYQETFIQHFCSNSNIVTLKIYDGDKYIGFGYFEKIDNTVLLLGMKKILTGEEVTDYGDIIVQEEYKNRFPEIWREIIKTLKEKNIQKLQLDYIREDSEIYQIFQPQAIEQAVAPHIELLPTWDEYLTSLERVDRKELKRKMRRLETIKYDFISTDKIEKENFEEFIRLHQLSDQTKRQFMSIQMKEFFWDLTSIEKNSWKCIVSFLRINNVNAASLMTFENESTIFGYNSGYDPAYNYYSAGLLLHGFKIKHAIESGMKQYDFLRGNERYKFDLGGKSLRLYQCVIDL